MLFVLWKQNFLRHPLVVFCQLPGPAEVTKGTACLQRTRCVQYLASCIFLILHLQFSISHLAFSILHIVFSSRIFYRTFHIFYLASQIFISHLVFFYLASRIFYFATRIFYLACRIFISNLAWIFKHHPEFISNLACLLQTSAHASWTLTSCAAYPSHLRIIGWEHLNKRRRIFLFLLKLGCCLKNIIPQKKEYSPSTLQTFDKLKER